MIWMIYRATPIYSSSFISTQKHNTDLNSLWPMPPVSTFFSLACANIYSHNKFSTDILQTSPQQTEYYTCKLQNAVSLPPWVFVCLYFIKTPDKSCHFCEIWSYSSIFLQYRFSCIIIQQSLSAFSSQAAESTVSLENICKPNSGFASELNVMR